ncbi:MAG: biotin/lipoyl-binding protein [Anaerolineales bacterium]|nr:biotin/lipoyl-binding protein [Anaerolineales bacterium]
MKHLFTHRGQTYELDLTPHGTGYHVTYQGQTYKVTHAATIPGQITLTLEGHTVTLHTAVDRDLRWVAVDGHTYQLKRETRTRRAQTGEDNAQGILHAPMPGQVRAVNVQVGESVTKGQTLLLLEAMKMEIRIQAPADGTVAKITVSVGDQVEKEQTLVEIA